MLGSVLTAIVTPFDERGQVDLEGFRSLCRHLVDNGSDGLVVTGTTGEASTLTDDERCLLFAAAVDELGGRGTVIAGTGTNSTADTIQLTERADELGVDGFLIVTPYYNKPPQRGIVAHFEAVAGVTERPIIAYNIPTRTVVNIEPATITQLARIPNLTAVKQARQAEDELDQARHIVACGLELYAGDDDLILPFLELGGVGGICVHTHVVGPQVQDLVSSFLAGDVDRARQLDEEVRPALEILRVQANPIAIKAALNLLGLPAGTVRLPLVDADESEITAVRGCLERLGLLATAAA